MTKKVLISGYSGFVGRNLLASLGIKFSLVGLSRTNIELLTDLHDVYTWDNLTIDQLKGVNCIVHLAGKAHDLKGATDGDEYFRVNSGLSKILFDTFLESTAPDFIYFSSVKAVADTVDDILYEDAAANPRTPYGQSKQAAEQYLLSRNLPEGKRLFIMRPCMIHGPGNKGNLNLLYKFVQKRIPYPLAAFDNKRSFLSIANLNFIIEKIISQPDIPGGIYNIADDDPLSTNEVINVIAQTIGLKAKLWKINPGFIKGLALLGDKLHLPLNTERLKKLTENYVVSNHKIKRVLQIDKLPVSSREGLITTIKGFSAR